LSEINSFPSTKISKYGVEFLNVIRAFKGMEPLSDEDVKKIKKFGKSNLILGLNEKVIDEKELDEYIKEEKEKFPKKESNLLIEYDNVIDLMDDEDLDDMLLNVDIDEIKENRDSSKKKQISSEINIEFVQKKKKFLED
jgi:hypothetical protein